MEIGESFAFFLRVALFGIDVQFLGSIVYMVNVWLFLH